jgi:hypothetical protein
MRVVRTLGQWIVVLLIFLAALVTSYASLAFIVDH